MTGDPLPDAHHIARYCSSWMVEDGLPTWRAFAPNEEGGAISVNWLDFFAAPDLRSTVGMMRVTFGARYTLRRNGRFAVLNVGRAKPATLRLSPIQIEHAPTDDNPAHAEVIGVPLEPIDVARALRRLVTERDIFEAVAPF